jgi:hypothetical protein
VDASDDRPTCKTVQESRRLGQWIIYVCPVCAPEYYTLDGRFKAPSDARVAALFRQAKQARKQMATEAGTDDVKNTSAAANN